MLVSGKSKLKKNNSSKKNKINIKTNKSNNNNIINYEGEDLTDISNGKKQIIIFKSKYFNKIYEKELGKNKSKISVLDGKIFEKIEF